MLWESSAKTYAEVDEALNAANINWDRVFADIKSLEKIAEDENMGVNELCDSVFQKRLSDYHPEALPQAWRMGVSFETPYHFDEDGDNEDGDNSEEAYDGEYIILRALGCLVHVDQAAHHTRSVAN